MSDAVQRQIPAGVKSALRREAHFGCAACGCPILEYHHIIPWAERKHNDVGHMIALCPTHHRQYGKLSRHKSYELKVNPFNARRNNLAETIGSNALVEAFRVGSNLYYNTPTVFSYFENPIIKCETDAGFPIVSMYFPKEDMFPELLIVRNDCFLNYKNLWDVEFRVNYLKLRRGKGDIFVEIDLRDRVANIRARININGEIFDFSPHETRFGSNVVKNSTMVDCKVALSVGDGRRMIWPNYAMMNPSVKFVGSFKF